MKLVNKVTYRYLLLHKPYGVLSQFTAELSSLGTIVPKRTLAEFDLPPDLYAAGRLDADSEGLLLLTNDGPLIKRMLAPGIGHERTYLVQVEGIPNGEAISKLERGVTIQNYRTLPARARLLDREPLLPQRNPPIRVRKNIPTSWIELTLLEGKNRQVRRMTAAVGYPTLRLIRIAIGTLTLDGIAPGQWRVLKKSEIENLKKQ